MNIPDKLFEFEGKKIKYVQVGLTEVDDTFMLTLVLEDDTTMSVSPGQYSNGAGFLKLKIT